MVLEPLGPRWQGGSTGLGHAQDTSRDLTTVAPMLCTGETKNRQGQEQVYSGCLDYQLR